MPVLPLGALLLLATVLGCGEVTGPEGPEVDMVGRWGSALTGSTVPGRLELGVRITHQAGDRLAGTAEANDLEYALEGRYRPPVVFLELVAVDRPTIRFVGEVTSRNVIDGSAAVDAEEWPPLPLLLVRR